MVLEKQDDVNKTTSNWQIYETADGTYRKNK